MIIFQLQQCLQILRLIAENSVFIFNITITYRIQPCRSQWEVLLKLTTSS